MCGRVVQVSDPLRFAFVDGLQVPDSRAKPPSYNVAPSQLLYVIREKHQTGKRTLELLRWGLIPHGCKDPEGGAQADQRACRICGAASDISRHLRKAPLHRARRLFF